MGNQEMLEQGNLFSRMYGMNAIHHYLFWGIQDSPIFGVFVVKQTRAEIK